MTRLVSQAFCVWAYMCTRALRPHLWARGLLCATLFLAPPHLFWLPLGPATSGVHNAVSLLQVPAALDLCSLFPSTMLPDCLKCPGLDFGVRAACWWVLALLTCFMLPLDKALSLFKPQIPYLLNKDNNNNIKPIEWWWVLDEIFAYKAFSTWLSPDTLRNRCFHVKLFWYMHITYAST